MTNAMTEEKPGKAAEVSSGVGTLKFRSPQVALTQAVDRVLNVVPQKTTMPVLGHLLVEAKSDAVKITATDLDLIVCTSVEAEVKEAGSVTLPAKRFSEIVRQLDPSADVDIDVRKANALITAGRANFRILGMGAEEFPRGQSLSLESAVAVPTETLKKAVQKTVFSVSRDETRRALTGVFWQIGGQSMAMVGTDGHRLARISIPVEVSLGEKKAVIVPTKALNQILRLTGEADDAGVRVKIADDHAMFGFGETVLFTRLIEGPFPKYEEVIPKENDKKVILKREEFMDALRRVSLLSDNLTHQVRVSLKRDLVELSARTQDIGEAKEEIEAQYGGEEMDLGYNAQYLGEILRNIEADEVLLSLSSPLNAALVEPLEQGEDENYLCLIMPLRLVD